MVFNLDITLAFHKPFSTGVMKATTLLGVRTEPAQNSGLGVAPDLPVLVSILLFISTSTSSEQPRT